jgi:very-short-patch-repair endonuclease
MARLHNKRELKPLRKNLRNNSTSAEAVLWKMLKNKQVGGFKFRRQHSIGKYIVDFYCPTLQLAIELDGEPHASLINIASDTARDEWLKEQGITVFRYENRWLFEYSEVIIEDILEFGEERKRKEV